MLLLYRMEELLTFLPANYFRRDAPKQQLSTADERKLELTRITGGVCDKGFWGGSEYAFGIFARTNVLRERLQNWKRVSVADVPIPHSCPLHLPMSCVY